MAPPLPGPDDVAAAHARVRPHVRRTPSMRLPRGALGGDWTPVLKLEQLQHAGSFKTRGAFNALLGADPAPAAVAAASGGNHGAAVAYAAARLGIPATIFVPEISGPAKLAAIRAAGARVVVGGARYADAAASCAAYVAESGAFEVHPYDAFATVAGQGTLAREWDEQDDDLTECLVAVGGGGLAAGLAAWWGPRVRVLAVEPDGSCALHAALAEGGPVDVPVESVAADSLGARRVGALPFALARASGMEALLVPDGAILAAQDFAWHELRLALEPGGAAALAAVLHGVHRPAPGAVTGIVLCGANLDPATLSRAA